MSQAGRVQTARERFWTPERIEQLRQLAFLKMSARKIAEAMDPSLTRCSIIGKARRAKIALLWERPAPKEGSRRRRPRGGQTHPRVVVVPEAIELEVEEALPPPPVPTYTAVNFVYARSDQCKFPLWDARFKTGDVCGAKAMEGKPYCPSCAKRANIGTVYHPRRAGGYLIGRY